MPFHMGGNRLNQRGISQGCSILRKREEEHWKTSLKREAWTSLESLDSRLRISGTITGDPMKVFEQENHIKHHRATCISLMGKMRLPGVTSRSPCQTGRARNKLSFPGSSKSFLGTTVLKRIHLHCIYFCSDLPFTSKCTSQL